MRRRLARLPALLREVAKRRVVRDGGWLALSQLASLVARMIGLRLITELTPPGVYAEIALLLGATALCATVFCLPITSALQRFYPDSAAAGRVSALRTMLWRILRRRTLLVALALAFCGSLWTIVSEAGVDPTGFVLVALLLVLDLARVFETTLLNAARQQRVFSAWTFVNEVGRPALAVAAIFVLGPEATSVLLGYVVAIAVGNLAFRRTTVRGDDSPDAAPQAWLQETRRGALSFAAPLMPVAAINWVLTFSDRYLLAWLAGARVTGIYAAGYGIASMPFIVWGALLSLTLRPIYFEAVAQGNRRRERGVFILWFMLLVPPMLGAIAVIALLSDPIVRLLLGESFWDAAELLPWIAGAYATQSAAQLFEHVIQAQRRTHVLPWMHGSAAIIAVGLYVVLIPEYGALGGAIGTLCGMTVSLVLAIGLSGGGLRSSAPGVSG